MNSLKQDLEQSLGSNINQVVAKLIESLSAKDVQVRIEAALALGKIGNENAVPALCRILATDQNSEVRRSAAEALGMIGGAAAES